MTPAVWQITGYKNSGKTTLIAALLPLLKSQGLRTVVIKHDMHGFEMDHPGTDTSVFRAAGAEAVAITSPYRTAVILEKEQKLTAVIDQLGEVDLVLVEGFKTEIHPKIVMLRGEEDLELLKQLRNVQAAAAARESSMYKKLARGDGELPVFDRNEAERIADFILTGKCR